MNNPWDGVMYGVTPNDFMNLVNGIVMPLYDRITLDVYDCAIMPINGVYAQFYAIVR